jgi:Nif-specific regulatory protein
MNNELFKLKDHVKSTNLYHEFIYKSPLIEEKLEIVKKIATSSSSILITGDSGTGKELFAEQIHKYSDRSDNTFIRINCAAIPENLIESELFGHIKGAFTDAMYDHAGKVDVRIIAATNRKLSEEVKAAHFREDLYYRLNVFPLEIPALKQRKEDILPLANHFLKKFNIKNNKNILSFSSSSVEAMLSYPWPGNVRELENSVERAVIITTSEHIRPQDLLLPDHNSGSEDQYIDSTLKDAVNLFK